MRKRVIKQIIVDVLLRRCSLGLTIEWSNFAIDPDRVAASVLEGRSKRDDAPRTKKTAYSVSLELFNAITQWDHLWSWTSKPSRLTQDGASGNSGKRERKSWEFFSRECVIFMFRRLIFFVCRSTSIVFCAFVREIDDRRSPSRLLVAATKTFEKFGIVVLTRNDNYSRNLFSFAW